MMKRILLPILILAAISSACAKGELKSQSKIADPAASDAIEVTADSTPRSENPVDVSKDEVVLSQDAAPENTAPPADVPPVVVVPPVIVVPAVPKPTLRLLGPVSLIRRDASTLQLSAELSTDRSSAEVRYALEAPLGKPTGSVSSAGIYTSPIATGAAYDVTIHAIWLKDESVQASSKMTLVPKDQFFTACTGSSRLFPIYADVYTVDVGITARIPNFATIPESKVTRVCLDSYSIPNGTQAPGFPGRSSLTEWFALQTGTRLFIPTAGLYRFRLGSDDGSKLTIDSQLVIDSDSLHPFGYIDGIMQLTAGEHPLSLNYFQGAGGMGLELMWMPPGSTSFTIIPPSAFR